MNPILSALVAAGALTPQEAEQLNRLLDDTAARAWAEQQLASAFGRGLRLQQGRLSTFLEQAGARIDDPALAAWWEQEDRLLYEDVIPTLREVVADRAIIATMRSGGLETWTAVNEAVIGWVEDYYISADAALVGSVPNLNQTARTQVGQMINAWQRGELEAATRSQGLPQLVAAMEDVFGPVRGERVAVTEVTRVFAESTRAAAAANPNTTRLRWSGAHDEIQCPICGKLDGQTIPKGQSAFPGGFFPPAHVSCRCMVLEESDATEAVPVGEGGAGLWTSPFA